VDAELYARLGFGFGSSLELKKKKIQSPIELIFNRKTLVRKNNPKEIVFTDKWIEFSIVGI
jgi:hypothetical protein